jgi:hypothetical protein
VDANRPAAAPSGEVVVAPAAGSKPVAADRVVLRPDNLPGRTGLAAASGEEGVGRSRGSLRRLGGMTSFPSPMDVDAIGAR